MCKKEIIIGDKKIGEGNPTYIVAEMSANHMQNYDKALAIVKAAAKAGVDAIKLQTYKPDTITINCHKDRFLAKSNLWDGMNLYDLYEEAYMPWEWHGPLMDEAKKLGMACFSSPFDPTAVELLETFDVPAYKIASYEISDIPLIRMCAATGKPIIIATGVAHLDDIERAVEACYAEGNKNVILMKCVSEYPTPYSDVNLRVIPTLREKFDVPVGLSDHTFGSAVAVASIPLGCCIIEKHLTIKRDDGGPDGGFSMEPDEFKRLVDEVRIAEQCLGDAEYKLTPGQEEQRYSMRSLYVIYDIKKGDVLTKNNVRSIRPGGGLPPAMQDEVWGRIAARNLERGEPLQEGDFI